MADLLLRITADDDGRLGVRCLCGAELASVRGQALDGQLSPAGLVRMVLHAKGCTYVQGDSLTTGESFRGKLPQSAYPGP